MTSPFTLTRHCSEIFFTVGLKTGFAPKHYQWSQFSLALWSLLIIKIEITSTKSNVVYDIYDQHDKLGSYLPI